MAWTRFLVGRGVSPAQAEEQYLAYCHQCRRTNILRMDPWLEALPRLPREPPRPRSESSRAGGPFSLARAPLYAVCRGPAGERQAASIRACDRQWLWPRRSRQDVSGSGKSLRGGRRTAKPVARPEHASSACRPVSAGPVQSAPVGASACSPRPQVHLVRGRELEATSGATWRPLQPLMGSATQAQFMRSESQNISSSTAGAGQGGRLANQHAVGDRQAHPLPARRPRQQPAGGDHVARRGCGAGHWQVSSTDR